MKLRPCINCSSPKFIVRSHIAMYCFRQKVYGQVFSPHSITTIQHFGDNALNYLYIVIVPLVITMFMNDMKLQKSLYKLKKRYSNLFVKLVDTMLVTWFLLFVQDVDYVY
jgi:hypothetical protein